jgi:hypothetical protein
MEKHVQVHQELPSGTQNLCHSHSSILIKLPTPKETHSRFSCINSSEEERDRCEFGYNSKQIATEEKHVQVHKTLAEIRKVNQSFYGQNFDDMWEMYKYTPRAGLLINLFT